MNNPAVRSSARVIRLADLEPLRAAPRPRQVWPIPTSTPAPSTWPPAIGSDAAEELMAQMRSVYVAATAGKPVRSSREAPRLPRGQVSQWPVVFEAQARDYARLWIINLALTLLTLGVYLPWARARTQRFFLRRTTVAGKRFDYHAPPVRHLPRYVLALGTLAGVLGAGMGSPMAGLLVLSLALAVTPMAVHASLTHRLGHISWAGRRLLFKGQFAAVYSALLAPLSAVVALLCLGVAASALRNPGSGLAAGLAMAVVAVAALVVMPFAQARLQNLVWNKTGNRSLRFSGQLPVGAYVRLQVRHGVLLLLTLGLYWPWAVVASRRMRTEALTVWARTDAVGAKTRESAFSAPQADAIPKRRASA
ncbi:MAG: DUF898 family protein [Rubrivivax sp.]|nr:MAG: DUF898 family protein [Rubrivivax sp.]